jgi:hypothetical protein
MIRSRCDRMGWDGMGCIGCGGTMYLFYHASDPIRFDCIHSYDSACDSNDSSLCLCSPVLPPLPRLSYALADTHAACCCSCSCSCSCSCFCFWLVSHLLPLHTILMAPALRCISSLFLPSLPCLLLLSFLRRSHSHRSLTTHWGSKNEKISSVCFNSFSC